jgi:hypothetical protein
MPARSNIFQRLVFELHRDLGPDWNVSESRLLTDTVTGDPREVDVVAEAVVGGYPLLLCIEVRDQGRPANVNWLEGMAQKHKHLPTSKLVLWSSSGYSASALKKAKALNIIAIAPDSAQKVPWAAIARQLEAAAVKFVQPLLEPFFDVIVADGSAERWEARPEMVVLNEEGTPVVQVGPFLKQITHNPGFGTIFLDHALEGSGTFHAICSFPDHYTVMGPFGSIGKISRMVIGITTNCEIEPVTTISAFHNGAVTTLAEASLSDGTLQIVVREQEQSSTIKSRLATFNEKRPVEKESVSE